MSENQNKEITPWHEWFGNLFKAALIPTGLDVKTNVLVMRKIPEADILIVRNKSRWTTEQLKRLPDGIRHTKAKRVMIEFKFTESIHVESILQAGGYYKFYKMYNKLDAPNDLKCFLISSKTPQKRTLERFRYHKGKYPGVYQSTCCICRLFPLISLNDLSDAPHNIMFKLFASKRNSYTQAIEKLKKMYHKYPGHLKIFIESFIYQCLMKGASDMYWNTVDWSNITPSVLNDMRQECLRQISQIYTPSELLAQFKASDILSNYDPSEVLSNYTPEQFYASLNLDQKKAIAGMVQKEKALHNSFK
jgi:hypothetical protein